jgi:hypothetical protein
MSGPIGLQDLKQDVIDKVDIYNFVSSSVDTSTGIYTVVSYNRDNGTLALRTTLSNKDANGKFLNIKLEFFAADGTTLINSKNKKIDYDANGNVIGTEVA